MPKSVDCSQNTQNTDSCLFWDMAGTLLAFDPITGRPGTMPGCREYLPELGKDFRLFVTTGDSTGSARALLRDFGLSEYFEDIYGDLGMPVGKPYGEIMRRVDGKPGPSLAIGDRLTSDICMDCDDLVTILVNQAGEVLNVGMVMHLIKVLKKQSLSFCEAFDKISVTAEVNKGAIGPARGGQITQAWTVNGGFPFQLWIYHHTILGTDRRVIVL
jgi:hypothetical protein